MGIEFSQIHNLVRTYQRILNQPPSKQHRGEMAGAASEDRISISPGAREHEEQARTEHLSDGFSRQDRERPYE
jgi:hypothetical protein